MQSICSPLKFSFSSIPKIPLLNTNSPTKNTSQHMRQNPTMQVLFSKDMFKKKMFNKNPPWAVAQFWAPRTYRVLQTWWIVLHYDLINQCFIMRSSWVYVLFWDWANLEIAEVKFYSNKASCTNFYQIKGYSNFLKFISNIVTES